MSYYLKPVGIIKARLGIQEGGPAHAFFTSECYKNMASFVPRGDTGLLNENTDVQVDKITFQSPYAHYQYNGKLYVDPINGKGAFYNPSYGFWSRPGIKKVATTRDLKYHTPGTGAFWDKRMWTSKGKEIVKEVQKYINGGCK